jgi:hypothetical protein
MNRPHSSSYSSTIRMENASIIRKNAQFIKSSMLTMISEGVIEKDHGYVIREEIDKFKKKTRSFSGGIRNNCFQ